MKKLYKDLESAEAISLENGYVLTDDEKELIKQIIKKYYPEVDSQERWKSNLHIIHSLIRIDSFNELTISQLITEPSKHKTVNGKEIKITHEERKTIKTIDELERYFDNYNAIEWLNCHINFKITFNISNWTVSSTIHKRPKSRKMKINSSLQINNGTYEINILEYFTKRKKVTLNLLVKALDILRKQSINK